MALDPEIQLVVDAMNALPPVGPDSVPVEQARAAHDAETVQLSGPGPEVASVEEVEAPGPGGPIAIRCFRPAGVGPLAVVAYAHGGGWVIGSLDGFDPLCRALANASGAIVAALDYRRAPEHPFPAPLEDVIAAVRWLSASAESLGGDPARLGVAGDSAGGNLVAVAARRLREDPEVEVRFQALIYPVTDSAVNTRSYAENAEGYGLTATGMARYWQLYLDGADGQQPDVSPLRAGDLEGLPPAYVLTVEHDVLRDEGEAYAAALERAGVPVQHARYDGAVHGFFRWLAQAALARDAVAEAGTALRAGLA